MCSIERLTSGYRLLVQYGETMQMDELYPSATAAQEKADALRAHLVQQGWMAE